MIRVAPLNSEGLCQLRSCTSFNRTHAGGCPRGWDFWKVYCRSRTAAKWRRHEERQRRMSNPEATGNDAIELGRSAENVAGLVANLTPTSPSATH